MRLKHHAESITQYVYDSGTKPYRLAGNRVANCKCPIKLPRPTNAGVISQLFGYSFWQYHPLMFDLQFIASSDLAGAL